MVNSKRYKRFDSSHKFWNLFGARKEIRKKKLGYYEKENIYKPCIISVAVNPKEYLKVFKNFKLNKKCNEIKKGSRGLGFENFTERIKSLRNFDTFEKPPANKKKRSHNFQLPQVKS